MKCISLHQPRASLIVIGAKTYETRSWPTSHRGPILIHAAKKWTKNQKALLNQEPFVRPMSDAWYHYGLGTADKPPIGSIIGVADLVECYRVMKDCHGCPYLFPSPVGPETHMEPLPTGDELAFGDFTTGRYAWKLANPRRFAKPIPYRGMQGTFNVPDKVVAAQIVTSQPAAGETR